MDLNRVHLFFIEEPKPTIVQAFIKAKETVGELAIFLRERHDIEQIVKAIVIGHLDLNLSKLNVVGNGYMLLGRVSRCILSKKFRLFWDDESISIAPDKWIFDFILSEDH